MVVVNDINNLHSIYLVIFITDVYRKTHVLPYSYTIQKYIIVQFEIIEGRKMLIQTFFRHAVTHPVGVEKQIYY